VKKCPYCENFTEFRKAPGNYGLMTWEENANGIAVNPTDFMPIKVENCSSCGYLNILFDTSQQGRVTR